MFKVFAFACLLSLSACATMPSAPVPATSISCGLSSNTVLDEKALFVAETAYNVPAQAYVTLNNAHKLPAGLKASSKSALMSAYSYVKLARTAYAAGDACGFSEALRLANQFSEQAKALLPSK